MEILQNQDAWSREYQAGWLQHLQQTGQINWDLYPLPRNDQAPASPGVRLESSRLLFISTAGGYLHREQEPFDGHNPVGDYSLRTFAAGTPFADLAYEHTHYDHAMIEADPQVALPLEHLRALVEAGRLGELSPTVISFMGYQPDAARVVDEMIPPLLEIARQSEPDAALLAPV